MRLTNFISAAALSAMIALPAFAQSTAPATTAAPKPPVTTTAPATTPVAPPVAPVTTPAAKPATTSAKPAAAAKPSATSPVSINTATDAQLDALPGIGKARVANIKAGRPYTTIDELDTKKLPTGKAIIPHSVFQNLKDKGLITL